MNLTVALIQADLHWENPTENKTMFAKKIHSIKETVDLIILPEMFTTGFSMNAEHLAEPPLGETFQWMKTIATEYECAITGSYIIKEHNQFFNRLLVVDQKGILAQYDKRHLFTLAGEHKIYTSGQERIVVELKGWRICPQICYDLRFPVWSRNDLDYDLLFYVANWPDKRISAWDTLLKARAIENMSYVTGVNRVGSDGNGYEHTGHSAVYDALGEQLSKDFEEKEGVQLITLDKQVLDKSRDKLRFIDDRDSFTID